MSVRKVPLSNHNIAYVENIHKVKGECDVRFFLKKIVISIFILLNNYII